MPVENVQFVNASGASLSGRLQLPEAGQPRACALFAHCFTCTKNIRAARTISDALCAEGFAVLRFDFAGLGQSEGEFADTNFSSNVSDLVAAADYLAREWSAPELLIGHSLGGTAVLEAAHSIDSARAVATIGSPSRASHVTHLFDMYRQEIETTGEATVSLAGRPFVIRRQFLDDLEKSALPDSLRSLRKALLVFHSPIDDTVGVDNAGEIFAAAMHPKSFISLDKADHLLSRDEDARYVASVLASWAHKYIADTGDAKKTGSASAVPAARDGETLAITRAGGFRTDINASGHVLVADEPASVGGTEAGPTPYDLLSASLAACTSMTLQMYARHKKIDLEAATVSVAHDRIHADDCADCETTGNAKLDRFTRTVRLTGNLSEEQRGRMLEIADRCPVHRTLHSEVVVETRAEEPGAET
ncbi:MAG: bifunctional alpha/beta hydrolase/OsmC family protein [Pseudomonadota bacterium]